MMVPPHDFHLVLAITGASGACYAARFLEKMRAYPHVRLSIILSKNGVDVWTREEQTPHPESDRWRYWDMYDFSAPFASGSNCADAMVVLPCSMGTVARISQGISDTLITRTADVQLKEHKPLVLVPRESPCHLIHLQNMTRLAEAGAIIAPASPFFYNQPQNMAELITPFIDRLLRLCNVTHENEGFRYG